MSLLMHWKQIVIALGFYKTIGISETVLTSYIFHSRVTKFKMNSEINQSPRKEKNLVPIFDKVITCKHIAIGTLILVVFHSNT